jgi:translation initiation factor 1
MANAARPVTIEIEERRYGKEVTIVTGLENRDIDLERLSSELKSVLACDGTTHEDAIELQDNHRGRIDAMLAEHGLDVR